MRFSRATNKWRNARPDAGGNPLCTGYHSSRSSGFTLMEILLAMVIFGMIVSAIFASWTAISRGSKAGIQAAAEVQRSRIALRTIEEALGATRSFAADMDFYVFEGQSGDSSYMSFVSRLSPSFPRGGRFGDFDVRRITFSIESGSDSTRELVMRQTPVLMEMDEDEKNHPIVLAKDVKKFDLEFYDKQQKEWVDEWAQTNQIPQMVKVTLQLGGGSYDSPAQQEITRIVALPSITVQPGWQAPGAQGSRTSTRNSGISHGANGTINLQP
jgi:general secretion pathway protein J